MLYRSYPVDGSHLFHGILALPAVPSVRHLYRDAPRLLRGVRVVQFFAIPHSGAGRRGGAHFDAQGQITDTRRSHVGPPMVCPTMAHGTTRQPDRHVVLKKQ